MRDINWLQNEINYSLFWLVFSVVVVWISAYSPWSPKDQKHYEWFQRSGSIVVVITIWVQNKLSSIFTFFDKDAYIAPIEIPTYLSAYYDWSNYGNLFLMIFGTIIWGYGDILIKKHVILSFVRFFLPIAFVGAFLFLINFHSHSA